MERMRNRWQAIRALVVIVAMLATGLAIPACSGSTDVRPTVQGTWSGSVQGQVLTLSLTESGGAVAGSGTITGTYTGTRALTVAGSFEPPHVSITMTSGTMQPLNLTATLAGKTMTGSLNGSGFTGEGITLMRQ
jgi:hypothetical protein